MRLKDCIGKKIYRTKDSASGDPSWNSAEKWLKPLEISEDSQTFKAVRCRSGFEFISCLKKWDDGNWALVEPELKELISEAISPLMMSFPIPENADDEIIAIKIMIDLFKDLDVKQRVRVLDYLSNRYN